MDRAHEGVHVAEDSDYVEALARSVSERDSQDRDDVIEVGLG